MRSLDGEAVLGAGLTFIAGSGIFFILRSWSGTLEWKPEVWASWVQAVGSIAAIFGSAWIARYSARKQIDGTLVAAKALRVAERQQNFEVLTALATATLLVLQQLEDEIATRADDYSFEQALRRLKLMLQKTEAGIDALPLQVFDSEFLKSFIAFSFAVTHIRLAIERNIPPTDAFRGIEMRKSRQAAAARVRRFLSTLDAMSQSH